MDQSWLSGQMQLIGQILQTKIVWFSFSKFFCDGEQLFQDENRELCRLHKTWIGLLRLYLFDIALSYTLHLTILKFSILMNHKILNYPFRFKYSIKQWHMDTFFHFWAQYYWGSVTNYIRKFEFGRKRCKVVRVVDHHSSTSYVEFRVRAARVFLPILI